MGGKRAILYFASILFSTIENIRADNQTPNLTPVLLDQRDLPFAVKIEQEDFQLPAGIQSAAAGEFAGEYLFITGRTNGLHGFSGGVPNNNFPPNTQNSTVFVINPSKKKVFTRSLYDSSSGLTQRQIDALSVTSPQFYQRYDTLYITGGYGVDTDTGNFSTKDTLTAINVPGLISWVKSPKSSLNASSFIRQISDPIFQVTGGAMFQFGCGPTLLIFGQNFSGYYTPGSNGDYTQQIRKFTIFDDGFSLRVAVQAHTLQDPNYRRRDLNVIPAIKIKNNKKIADFIALSGVFTPSQTAPGIWTVPIEITAHGESAMADPSLPATFKQGMNNYYCAHVPLLSKHGSMYLLLFGGITYEYFQNGAFLADAEFPFTNQVTVVKRDRNGLYSQYLLSTEYPAIRSNASNPGNLLLFGAGAKFMPAYGIPAYANGVLNLAKIKNPTVIGYIIGGIQSTLPNTNAPSDSAASPYVFKVVLYPKNS